jgi:hypothetical protein
MIRKFVAMGVCLLLLGACNEQKFPFTDSSRYQITRLDDNHALIIDKTTGDLWYFIDAPIGVTLRYVGKTKLGNTPGDIVSQFRLL